MSGNYHPNAYFEHCANVGDSQYLSRKDTPVRLARIMNEASSAGLQMLSMELEEDGAGDYRINTVFHHPELPGWKFDRRWVYWSASCDYTYETPIEEWIEKYGIDSTTPLPTRIYAGTLLSLERAKVMWREHGGTIRADGHCGSPEPTDEVDCYHIDTPQSLRHLVVQLLMNQAGVPVESNVEVDVESTAPTEVESNTESTMSNPE